jgi:hypothetical protein
MNIGEWMVADEGTQETKERKKGGEGLKYERNGFPQETKFMHSL